MHWCPIVASLRWIFRNRAPHNYSQICKTDSVFCVHCCTPINAVHFKLGRLPCIAKKCATGAMHKLHVGKIMRRQQLLNTHSSLSHGILCSVSLSFRTRTTCESEPIVYQTFEHIVTEVHMNTLFYGSFERAFPDMEQ